MNSHHWKVMQALGASLGGLGMVTGRGLAVSADISAQIDRRNEVFGKCKILGIPFDSASDLDELESRCRLAASGGVPTCVDDLPAEKRAEVVEQIARMNAVGVSVTKSDIDALMRKWPLRVPSNAKELQASLQAMADEFALGRRKARNKAKRERRVRKGK